MEKGRMYVGRVEEVHSGDDFIAMVSLGVSGLYKKTRIRLHGVDAPNAYKEGPETVAGRIREEVRILLLRDFIVTLVSEGRGGWIAEVDVETPTGEKINLNSLLRERGFVYRQDNKCRHEGTP